VFIAFAAGGRLAEGPLPDVALAVKRHVDAGAPGPLQVVDAATSAPVDLWLAGTEADVERLYRTAADAARVVQAPQETLRLARERCDRFLSAALGDATGFEEATRALFAGDAERFAAESAAWPADLCEHARRLADAAFTPS
jgi:hypothetical protein